MKTRRVLTPAGYSRRHERMERELKHFYAKRGWTVISCSTKAPCDFVIVAGGLWRMIEVKAGQSKRLSPAQRKLRDKYPENFITIFMEDGEYVSSQKGDIDEIMCLREEAYYR